MSKHGKGRRAIVLGLGLVVSGAALAQGAAIYPSRPIQLVVPFPAGGNTDVVGRMVAAKLGEQLGQSIVVENRAGAGTVIGAAFVAKAPADGYTLLISSGSTFTSGPAITPKLPYDPVKSFEPIGLLGRNALVLLAGKSVAAHTFKDVVAATQAKPDGYNYASFGNGSTAHFAGEMIKAASGIRMTHVPYKGSAPAMNDLLGGQIEFDIDTVPAALPYIKEGRIKPIVVTTTKRSTLLPNVPTLAESGVKLPSISTWVAIVAPKGLPPDVKAKLQKALANTVTNPQMQEKLLATGFEVGYADGKAVETLIAEELPRLKAVALQSGIHAD